MIKVLIVGATGQSGKALIERLSQENLELSLFLRNKKSLNKGLENMRVFEGNAKSLEDLRLAVKGQDFVISALGGSDLGKMTENLVKAMKEENTPYIIAINAGGIYNERGEPFESQDKKMIPKSVWDTHLQAADAIENSGLDYTILRPVWLNNGAELEIQLSEKGEV